MSPNKVKAKSNTKQQQKINKSLLKELPYYQLKGSLVITHGEFNNSLNSELLTKRDIEKLPSLYDLDLFSLNKIHDNNPNADDNLLNQRISSRYFSPHNLKQHMNRLTTVNRGTGYETLKPFQSESNVAIDVKLAVTLHNLLFSLRTGSKIRCA